MDEKKIAKLRYPVSVWPNYELPKDATSDEMRATAVRAMRDELTFEWTPAAHFTYRKEGACADRLYEFIPGTVYEGLPYTSGSSGLIQWLHFYDPETGVFSAGEEEMAYMANSCAASVQWAIATVCSSIRGKTTTYHMTMTNHFIPLGKVTFPPTLTDYEYWPTDRICRENGEKVMYEAYALLGPGDAVCATDRYPREIFPKNRTDRHAMMVTEWAHVVRNADGEINPDESCIVEQDQRPTEVLIEKEPGYFVSRRGRLDHVCTFRFLFNKSYVPLSTPEFQGLKAYTPAEASTDVPVDGIDALYQAKIRSNYRLALLYAEVQDESGNCVKKADYIMTQYDVREMGAFATDKPFAEMIPKEALFGGLPKGKYRCIVRVAAANGKKLTPVDFPFTV